MTPPVRIAAFVMALAIAFLAGRGLGVSVGPVGEPPASDHGTGRVDHD